MKSTVEPLLELWRSDPERTVLSFIHTDGAGQFVERPVTIRRWLEGAAACAEQLRKCGVGKGDRVIVALPTSSGWLEAFWGAVAMGAVAVPMPSALEVSNRAALQARFQGVLGTAGPRAVITDEATEALLTRLGLLPRTLAVLPPPAGTAPVESLLHENVEPSAPMFIQFTSGSTGAPKGVIITHGNLRANVAGIARRARVGPSDRLVSWLPLHHDMGLIGGVTVPAMQGAHAMLLSPLDFVLSPSLWLRAMSRFRATLTVAPNFAYSLVARKLGERELAEIDLSAVRLAFNGAEPIDAGTASLFCQRFAPRGFRAESFYPVYGLAETTLAVTLPEPGTPLRVDHVLRSSLGHGKRVGPALPGDAGAVGFVSVGRPLEGHSLAIVDVRTRDPLPDRHLGEICVSGPSVSPGYVAAGAAPSVEVLPTGDVGYVAEGQLFVVDRIKDVIIIAGKCYVPSDVERAVDAVPSVRPGRSVAFGVRSNVEGTESLVVIAEVRSTLTRGLGSIESDVRRAVGERVGLTPREIFLARPGALAVTSSGKLMRSAAKERWLSGEIAAWAARSLLHPATLWSMARRYLMRRQIEKKGAAAKSAGIP